MPGLFSRIKTWVTTEDVTHSDLNAEFDNVITNFVPLMIDDYSTNVAQMQVVTDPGEVGTESLATTLAGELARLRNMIKEISGEDQWYETPVASLTGLSNAIGTTGFTANRLVSGRVRTDSDQPIFLVPNGAARTVKCDGTPTNFKYYVESTEYTISTDVTLTNLTAAPGSNNTCLVNDANAADQDWTKYSGEFGSELTIDTVGSEITALVGKLAAFSLNNGSTTEMFIARVETNKLVNARRGYFFDSADAPSARIVFSNNDTITLLKLSWIFAATDGTLTVTYTNPVWSYDEPSSPATNDYWFDYTTNKWRKYSVSSFIDADATLIGVCCQDTTNCIGARSYEFFKNYADLNTIEIAYETNAQVRARFPGASINVWGNNYKVEQSLWLWDMTLDLYSGVSEDASTFYFFYVTEDGDRKIDKVRPYDRREDLYGYYHPHHSWRCVGYGFNNGSSNLEAVESYFNREPSNLILPSQTAARNLEVVDQIVPLDSSGGAFTHYLPPAAYCRGQIITLIKTGTGTNAVTVDGFGSETINGLTTIKLVAQYDFLRLLSDGSNWLVLAGKNYSEVWVQTGNGRGSTNTPIRRFTTTTTNLGSAITYADSATLGATFTINEAGLYSINYAEAGAAAGAFGISLNTANVTTVFTSLADGTRVINGYSNDTNISNSVSGLLRLAVSDVIRPHTDASFDDTEANNTMLRIIKVGIN